MRYSSESIRDLSVIVSRWQYGEQLRGNDAREFSTLVTNVSNDRWNKHFGLSKRDWTDTRLMREEVPLVFMQYLKYRRSVRLAGGKCCPVYGPVYPTLMYTLYEFRMQFPRIVSVLTANHVGITLLNGYEPRIIPYMVQLPVYRELHTALCIMRKLAHDNNSLLYGPQRHTVIHGVLEHMYNGRIPLPTAKSGLTNRVLKRRMLVVNAASDILASRVLSHHDACNNQPKSSYIYHLHQNNTNEEH